VDLDQARLWVRRLKNGLAVELPIRGEELRADQAASRDPSRRSKSRGTFVSFV
jgi:hypothetical protein